MGLNYNDLRALDSLHRRVKSAKDAPTTPHWAIISFSSTSVYVPGDQRSIDAPGHGYPARTETYESIEYYSFTDRAVWEKVLNELYRRDPGRTDILALYVEPARPKVSVRMEVASGR